MNLKFLSWQEGKYSDLWFIVHLFSGIAGGTLFLLLGITETYTWIACGVLSVSWEIWERKIKIPETNRNILLDIVVAFIGVYIGYLLLERLNYSQQLNIVIFIVEIAAVITLSKIGWRNYRR